MWIDSHCHMDNVILNQNSEKIINECVNEGVNQIIIPSVSKENFDKEKQVIPVFNAPKEPKERISLTLSRLSNTKNTIFMISGKNKKIALKKLQTGQNFLTNLMPKS